ncbi:[Protein-PII] uridylyltransferase [Gossypium australe]|uniref:RING-type E3 ubiquitin transferase n=1 Tax=Gossypium australe TaxID=47621 RepID=A0A5B6UNW0_9ROSI|nr:[Protein-PII] uridylyltransferase [Gossypium australe]
MQAASISSLDEVKLIFQHVKCEQDTNRTGSAKVTAVLRSVTKTSFQRLERLRTGLSGSTLAVEGIWNCSSRQLSMVGCQETVDSGPEGCDYVISMYFPLSFSIKQRSFLFGTISNVKKDTGLDNPLYFSAMQGINTRNFTEYLSDNYSMIKLVNAFERRTIPYQILSIAKQWFFKHPALKDAEEPLAQLNRLTRKLASDGSVVVPDDQLIAGPKSRVLVQIKVLSVGPLLVEGNLRNKTVITKDEFASCRFWNVSMHLAFKTEKELKQTTYKDVSELSLEGVYDPSLGEMHLEGFDREYGAMGIERGQDCLILVKIQYPPLNLQLWKKPTAKITINSQRKVGDPLYFNLINIHAHLSYYLDYFEADTQQAYFEAIIGSLLLTMSITIIWNQLLYMKFLGYSLPLICNAKVVLQSMVPKDYDWPPPANGMLKFIQSSFAGHATTYCKTVHMVIESRSKAMSEGSFKLRHAPREKRVMLTTMAICAYGVLILLVSVDKQNGHVRQTWMDVMVSLVYIFQDFFLLPQIISNRVMAMPVKCLREGYYLGLTTVRLLVLYFDYLMDPTIYTSGKI